MDNGKDSHKSTHNPD